MSNEMATAITRQGRSEQTNDWSSWKSWKETIDEHSAVAAMQFLKKRCEVYKTALTEVREEYEKEKQKNDEQNVSNLKLIEWCENTALQGLRKEHDRAMVAIDTCEKESYTAYHNDLKGYLKNNEPKGFVRRIVEKMIADQTAAMKSSAQDSYRQMKAMREQLAAALKAQREQQKLLYQKELEQARAEGELDRSNEYVRYDEKLETLKRERKEKISKIEREFRGDINKVMSNFDIDVYRERVLSSIPAFESYTCQTVVPECIHIGDVSMEIASSENIHSEDFERMDELMAQEVAKALDTSVSNAITAKLPYCQRLKDGISLFLNYAPSERKLYQDQLKMMLLKLFMAFPAGKLEATMIDPLELGETFALFTKLGEEQPGIIDTKIWSQEKDITEAINILRQKLETMTQDYGEDKAARLKKEPIRVLAITDFPTGFTQKALLDLQAIVRKGVSYGVCVFIWANSEEIAKLQDSQQSIFNEIKQMLHVASAAGNGVLKLECADCENVYLRLDPMTEAQDYVGSIIDVLTKGIHNARKEPERFGDMYDGIEDSSKWFAGNTIDELSIPIGIKGANTVVKMIVGKTDGSTAHHALIAGQTGAGKSTLLHTIIMSTLLNYSPDEVQLYLVDFKEGVEFKAYSKLNFPSIRVVAIDCEREFGLNILEELQKEMKRRFNLFKQEADRGEISDYRKVTGKKMPKILLVFDEVQELFRSAFDDSISRDCEKLLGELLTQGRAAGIHIILASQNFNLIPSIKPTLFAHAAIRIAIKGSEDSACSVLGDSNPGARQLQNDTAGAAVYNDASGRESANVIFRVGYLEKDERDKYLKELSDLRSSEEFAERYKGKTRVLLTSAEDDIFNVFNQLISNKKVVQLDEDAARYCLTIGDGFKLNREFRIGIAPRAGENLLVISNDEKRAAGIFYFSILSLLYDELGNARARRDSRLIRLIDFSAEEDYIEPSDTNFKHIESLFPKQVERVGMGDMDKLIGATYDTLVARMDGEKPTDERVFLMFFGINRAHKLVSGNMYEESDNGKMSTLSKLVEIMKHGAEYGVNCIVWGESLEAARDVIGAGFERDFAQRIAFSTEEAAMKQLVMEQKGDALRPTTAVYMNVDSDVKNTHFRPYEIPAKDWVNKIAEAYREFEQGEGTDDE